MREPETKVMTLEAAQRWRAALRQAGRPLVFTNGCFDLLHRGHAQYLAQARAFGAALLVGVNSDASIRAIKGPGRPVVAEQDRAYLVACLESVDAVVVFATPKATPLLAALAPDIYVKGGDYTEDTLDREEYAVLKAHGAAIRIVPLVSGFSTTATIRRVREEDRQKIPGGKSA